MITKTPCSVLLTLLALGFLLLQPGSLLAGNSGEFEANRMVCEMRQGYNIAYITSEYHASVINYLIPTNAYLLATQPGVDVESLAANIALDPAVLYCSANYYLDAPEPFQRSSPFLDDQMVGTFEDQPAAAMLSLGAAHTMSTGSAVRIGIIDTGINFNHPQFAALATGLFSKWDYVDNDPNANDEAGGIASGHGTFVAGTVALVAPGADLYAYRALDTTGRGDGYSLARAIARATDDGCRIINLSLGMRGRNDAVADAITYAESLGVIVVAAAGNDSTGDANSFPFPAQQASVLAVAALDSLNLKADFSNWGEKVGLCAPGTRVYAPYRDTLYAWWDGTSFSAPMVTGVAALLLQVDPDLTAKAVDSILGATATNVDGINPAYAGNLGKGLVNPAAALTALNSFTCGDVDASGVISITDVVYLINYIFSSGPAPIPSRAGDCDCNGMLNISDAVYLISYIFAGGNPPCTNCP